MILTRGIALGGPLSTGGLGFGFGVEESLPPSVVFPSLGKPARRIKRKELTEQQKRNQVIALLAMVTRRRW